MRSDETPVALANFPQAPVISGNGRFVLFATNEDVDPDDTNGIGDVYVRDLTTGTTELVSRNYDGLASGIAARTGGCRRMGASSPCRCDGADMLAPGKDTNGVTMCSCLIGCAA